MDLKYGGIVAAFASAYATFVALLYQYGYWHRFNINPLSYSSISDTASSVLLIILPISVIFCIGGIPSYFLIISQGKKNQVLYRIIFFVFAIILLLLLYFTSYIPDQLGFDSKFYFFSAIPVFALVLLLTNAKRSALIIPSKSLRFPISAFVICIPFLSFNIGWQSATVILKNKNYFYIPTDYVPESIKKISNEEGVKYVGKIGEYVFLTSFSNDTFVIFNNNDISPLVIKKHYHQPTASLTTEPSNEAINKQK